MIVALLISMLKIANSLENLLILVYIAEKNKVVDRAAIKDVSN